MDSIVPLSKKAVVPELKDIPEYCLENEAVKSYIDNVIYNDNDYSYTLITPYASRATSYNKDFPAPVFVPHKMIELADNMNFVNSMVT